VNKRIDALDGLRGLAAFTVAFSHYTLQTHYLKDIFGLSGQIGVMVFFVLSGYLMGKLYIDRSFSLGSVRRYFRHRLGRILPLYILVVLVCYGFNLSGHWWPFIPMDWHAFLNHILFVAGKGVFWTIPVEVQFYLLFPLLWYARSTWSEAVFLWAGSAICTVAFMGFPSMPAVAAPLPFFLTGVICSRIDPKSNIGMNPIFLLAMVGYVYCWPEISGQHGVWREVQTPIVMAIIVLSTANSTWAATLLGNPVVAYFGRISYSIYLWHMPILVSLLWLWPLREDTFLFIAAYLGTVTAAATLSFYCFEDPVRRLIYGEHLVRRNDLPERSVADQLRPFAKGSRRDGRAARRGAA
jgi:peptidoglycan/LPS O-acetylase OafA/YrhL